MEINWKDASNKFLPPKVEDCIAKIQIGEFNRDDYQALSEEEQKRLCRFVCANLDRLPMDNPDILYLILESFYNDPKTVVNTSQNTDFPYIDLTVILKKSA